jgi:hypothetical protein
MVDCWSSGEKQDATDDPEHDEAAEDQGEARVPSAAPGGEVDPIADALPQVEAGGAAEEALSGARAYRSGRAWTTDSASVYAVRR